MRFLVYSDVNASNIATSLGRPEYSYYFVLKEFMPVLQQLGEVIVVHDPLREVDPLFHQALADGERCVFLSFSPPHKTVRGLICPTIPIFAWEFDTIPDETWHGQPEQDWRRVLEGLGRAVVHSNQTVRAIHRAVRDDFPVMSIPAPVWDRLEGLRQMLAEPRPVDAEHRIRVPKGVVVDTRTLDLGPYRPGPNALEEFVAAGQPKPVVGPAEPTEEVRRPGARQVAHITTRYLLEWYRLVWRDLLPAPVSRALAAIKRRIRPSVPSVPAPAEEPAASAPIVAADTGWWVPGNHELVLDGVVFTSILNPYDGRKNWTDILTAFCTAFREVPDATLLFKLTHQEYRSAVEAMLTTLARLPEFRCRIVLVHGFLEQSDFNAFIQASDFVVNASHGEGQCLPLMEMLSCGIPALAPRNSAMLDYMDNEVGFLVNSWEDGTAWPHDPRLAYRTCRHQLDWASLRDAYLAAYQCYRESPQEYRRLSANAIERMRGHCSLAVARQRLCSLLQLETEACA
ncbi:glycosyltransferase [Pseudomonas sp. CAN2814]|uniref:glycosyltransferase n=1 Tax=Pseudomonas sp. CAN1 TaxID=3046726 RepID=UPI002648701B|nr:glycosyltransferase [Pseudomonas sp. CAN1]MDN6855253.1 glycosyltransferase [Pseudomonas sp. CAN1]